MKRTRSRICRRTIAACLLIVAFSACAPMFLRTTVGAQVVSGEDVGDAKNDSRHEPHRWGAITLFHGLPSERVRGIAQDADGVLWFGTDAGLARYDGRRTQSINIAELPAASVGALALDARGVLWVGTTAGVARRIGNAFHVIEETRGRNITTITHAADGRTLLGAESAILEARVRADGAAEVTELASASALTDVALDARGNLFAATRGRGVLHIAGNTAREVFHRPRAYFVEALEQSADGAIWFGAQSSESGNGLYKMTGENAAHVSVERMNLPTGSARAIRADAAGNLWVGTNGRGVFRLRADGHSHRWTFENTAGGLLSNVVNAICIDREGVVWFGTERGVCRFDPGAMRRETLAANPEGDFVRIFYSAASGVVLCGTNRGLFLRTGEGIWQPVADLADETIHALGEDERGRLLVGTARGLYTEDLSARRGANRYARFSLVADRLGAADRRSVRAIALFRGQIYLGIFGAGVERLEDGTRTPVRVAAENTANVVDSNEVTSLHAEGDKRLWVGTARGGVWQIEAETSEAVMRPSGAALAPLKGRAVWDIEGRDDVLWFATSDGLHRFAQGELRNAVEGVDARSVHVLNAVEESDKFAPVWCATNNDGLLAVRVAGGEVITSRLGVEHGLPAQNVFAITRLRNAENEHESFLIGTSHGAARYTPSVVAPLVRLARFGNEIIGDGETPPARFALAYPQNNLALDVSATATRTYPEQFRYQFRLHDEQGHLVASRFASDSHFAFDDLAPGRYAIEAQAYSVDLLASAPLRFTVEVGAAPFPWATAGLSSLLALTLAALIWGARQNRRIRRTSLSLAAANRDLAAARLALATEAETERRRIARDLHDQTLADLRRLMLRADEISARSSPHSLAGGDTATKTGGASLDSATLRHEVEIISTEVRRICEDLSPSVLENVGFAAALEWVLVSAVEQLPAETKFMHRFICDDDFELRLRLGREAQIQLYRIVQEALNNVGQHAGASAVVLTANFIDDDTTLLLRLEDDGHGFDARASNVRAGRGLTGIRARAAVINAEVEWLPRAERGTIFTVKIANSPRA